MARSVLLEPGQDPNQVIARLRHQRGIDVGGLAWVGYVLAAAAFVFSMWWMFGRTTPAVATTVEAPAMVIPTGTPIATASTPTASPEPTETPAASSTPTAARVAGVPTLPPIVQTLSAWKAAAGEQVRPLLPPTSTPPAQAYPDDSQPAAATATPRQPPTAAPPIRIVVEVTRIVEVTRMSPATVVVVVTATAEPTATPSPTASSTPTPTATPTITPTATSTATPDPRLVFHIFFPSVWR